MAYMSRWFCIHVLGNIPVIPHNFGDPHRTGFIKAASKCEVTSKSSAWSWVLYDEVLCRTSGSAYLLEFRFDKCLLALATGYQVILFSDYIWSLSMLPVYMSTKRKPS